MKTLVKEGVYTRKMLMFISEFLEPFKLTSKHFLLKSSYINKEYCKKNSRLSKIKNVK